MYLQVYTSVLIQSESFASMVSAADTIVASFGDDNSVADFQAKLRGKQDIQLGPLWLLNLLWLFKVEGFTVTLKSCCYCWQSVAGFWHLLDPSPTGFFGQGFVLLVGKWRVCAPMIFRPLWHNSFLVVAAPDTIVTSFADDYNVADFQAKLRGERVGQFGAFLVIT